MNDEKVKLLASVCNLSGDCEKLCKIRSSLLDEYFLVTGA